VFILQLRNCADEGMLWFLECSPYFVVDGVKKAKVAPVKAAPTRKISVVKVIRSKPKPGPRGTSEIRLALVNPIGVSKKFSFLDMSISSQGQCDKGDPTVQMTSECASHVIACASLEDSSLDTREASPLGKTATMDVRPHPIATHGCYFY
jgi:hypothetical protein